MEGRVAEEATTYEACQPDNPELTFDTPVRARPGPAGLYSTWSEAMLPKVMTPEQVRRALKTVQDIPKGDVPEVFGDLISGDNDPGITELAKWRRKHQLRMRGRHE